MSSRDPYFQFAWDSTVHGEVELEMDDSALGIGSLGVRVRVRHYSRMMRGSEQDLSKVGLDTCCMDRTARELIVSLWDSNC